MIQKTPVHQGCGNACPCPLWGLLLGILVGCLWSASTLAQSRTDDTQTQPPRGGASSPAHRGIAEASIRLHLTDPNGLPVAGAMVGAPLEVGPEMPEPEPESARQSDQNGEVVITLSDISLREMHGPADVEEIRARNLPYSAVYALHQERKLGAIQAIWISDIGQTVQVRLQPLSRVQGTLSCPDLPATTLLDQISARVQWQAMDILQQFSARQKFDFPLPPGEYTVELEAYGHQDILAGDISISTLPKMVPVQIADGGQHLDLGDVKLRPTKIATLIGQSAPELGPIQAWRNGPPVTLAGLRGQVVILYFGGEYPLGFGDISTLAEIQKTFGNKGLTILAIYNCASMEELERRWKPGRQGITRIDDVPFRIAIDGGEPTTDEATGRQRLGATYGTYGILGSTSILIDRAGRLLGEHARWFSSDVIRRLLEDREYNTEVKAGAEATTGDRILLRLVDPNGQPVVGAKIVKWMSRGESPTAGSEFGRSHAAGISDENGRLVLEADQGFLGPFNPPTVYILHEGRGLGAVQEVGRKKPAEAVPVVLKPVCRVHGILDSTGLEALGMPLRQTNVIIATEHDILFQQTCGGPKHTFDFPVPPGMYRLAFSGKGSKKEGPPGITAATELRRLPAWIPEGQRNLNLGAIDLRPTKLASLIGRPAPEIGPIKAWQNGSAVTLAELRGQVVWLHFDGPYTPGPSGNPALADLQETFGDQGLTIIAISSSPSLEELERKAAQADARFGRIPQVPYRLAIDGGEGPLFKGIIRMRRGVTHERYDIVASTDVLIDRTGNVVGEPALYRAKEIISQMLGPKEDVRSPSP